MVQEMERVFEITIKNSDPEFGKIQSNLMLLVTYIEFTDEIIKEFVDPTDGPIRQQINEWGPHAVWVSKSLDNLYNMNS